MKQKIGLTPNQAGIRSAAMVCSILLLVAGVIYCEVMFLSMVEKAFPVGLLRVFATIGAVVGGASVLLLLLSKSYWFTEGVQLIFAYIFTGLEVILLVLNVILAFELNSGHVDSWLQVWQTFSPATPVIAIVGWTIIWALDAGSKRRHTETNMENDLHENELDYRSRVAGARNDLRHKYLTQIIADMEEEIQSAHIRGQGRLAASQMAADALTEVTGIPVAPRLGLASAPGLPSGESNKPDFAKLDENAVEADKSGEVKQEPVMSFAQTAEAPAGTDDGPKNARRSRRKESQATKDESTTTTP